MYKYLKKRGLKHKQLGKVIVATSDDEIETLKDMINERNKLLFWKIEHTTLHQIEVSSKIKSLK